MSINAGTEHNPFLYGMSRSSHLRLVLGRGGGKLKIGKKVSFWHPLYQFGGEGARVRLFA